MEIPFTGQVMVEIGCLQQCSDLLTLSFGGRFAKPGISSTAGAKDIHDDAKEGGLATAVGAKYAKYGPWRYVEGYFVQCTDLPVVFCDALNGEDITHDRRLYMPGKIGNTLNFPNASDDIRMKIHQERKRIGDQRSDVTVSTPEYRCPVPSG